MQINLRSFCLELKYVFRGEQTLVEFNTITSAANNVKVGEILQIYVLSNTFRG